MNFLKPRFASVPGELKQQPWAVWIAEPKRGKPDKFNKAPRCPKGGFKVGASKPELFGTFNDAQGAYESGGYTGIGVLLTGNGIIGIDIDDYEDAFIAQPDVKAWLVGATKAGAYCEKSPSSKGLRLFMQGKLPGNGRKSGSLEIYDDARFLTVTGHVFGLAEGSELTGIELIQGQRLVDAFLSLLPTQERSPNRVVNATVRTGSVGLDDIPIDAQLKLSPIFAPNMPIDSRHRALFSGDTSAHGYDHSAADMALTGFMAKQGCTPDEVDLVFRASGLYRPKWDEMRGEITYGQRTIAKVFDGLPIHRPSTDNGYDIFADIVRYRPAYVEGGMTARRYVGPEIDDGVRLFPASALSVLVSLGAGGKTSLLIALAAHVAAGKAWNGKRLSQEKVVMFSVEEAQDELNRKFSALVDSWPPEERQAAIDHLLLVSLQGQDARLTEIERGNYRGSGIAGRMIGLIKAFGLRDGLVVLDHMQGFASGDLNISETATSICREANKIVDATGSAVVFAAHISKANLNAEELAQGFAVGSLAFENAVRQMAGMIPMSKDQAKKFGLEENRKEYVWLGVPKNSYGSSTGGTWLKKVVSPKYHTVVMEPVQLNEPISAATRSANEKLTDQLIDYLTQHPWITKNRLDGLAGSDGPFKASKQRIRVALKAAIDAGAILVYSVTPEERTANSLPQQAKEVLRAAA